MTLTDEQKKRYQAVALDIMIQQILDGPKREPGELDNMVIEAVVTAARRDLIAEMIAFDDHQYYVGRRIDDHNISDEGLLADWLASFARETDQ